MNTPGVSIAETLVALTIVGFAVSIAVPATRGLRSGVRMSAASRELALTLQSLRWRSVSTNRGHGLWFRREANGWSWVVVRDGNGNGIRTAEIRNGTDRVWTERRTVGKLGTGVRIGIPGGGPYPRVPPARGTIGAPGDPVRFGRSDLIAFSPLGSASSGTLYLTDGTGALSAIVVFGPTARIRIWRYDRTHKRWT